MSNVIRGVSSVRVRGGERGGVRVSWSREVERDIGGRWRGDGGLRDGFGREGFEKDAYEPSGFATGEIDADVIEVATESFVTPGKDGVKDSKFADGAT